jgi:multidrug efflux system membrane fusion protein
MAASLKIALFIIVIIFGWVISGSFSSPAPEKEEIKAAETPSKLDLSNLLEVTDVAAEPRAKYVVLYGATEANRVVNLKAETEGTVTAIPATEGQLLKKGNVILTIDERDRKEQLAQAKALVKQREIEYQAAQKLFEKGFRAETGLAEAKTNIENAKAGLKRIELDLKRTKLRAPFNGVLEEVNVEIGDFVGVGVFGGEGAIVSIVDKDPIIVLGQVSEQDISLVNKDVIADITLADGRVVEGKVRFVGSVADPDSRTFRVEIEVANKQRTIPAGVTAEIRLAVGEEPAYLVSPAVLSLDDNGKVGVKVVDDANIIQFLPVRVIEDSDKGIWIGGLPDKMRLITQGQAFASPGLKLGKDEG